MPARAATTRSLSRSRSLSQMRCSRSRRRTARSCSVRCQRITPRSRAGFCSSPSACLRISRPCRTPTPPTSECCGVRSEDASLCGLRLRPWRRRPLTAWLVCRVRWQPPAADAGTDGVEVSFHFAPLSNQFGGISLEEQESTGGQRRPNVASPASQSGASNQAGTSQQATAAPISRLTTQISNAIAVHNAERRRNERGVVPGARGNASSDLRQLPIANRSRTMRDDGTRRPPGCGTTSSRCST